MSRFPSRLPSRQPRADADAVPSRGGKDVLTSESRGAQLNPLAPSRGGANRESANASLDADGGNSKGENLPAKRTSSKTSSSLTKTKEKRKVELYLAHNQLEEVPEDITNYCHLAFLWLDNNLLSRLPPLSANCLLTEVYLHRNRLVSVKGAFRSLFCLQTLFLHNNQLRDVDEVVAELRPLKALRVLNLFDNPLTQEAGYRLKIIGSLSQIQVLDRRDVEENEKRRTNVIINGDHTASPIFLAGIARGHPTFPGKRLAFGSSDFRPPPQHYVRGCDVNTRRQRDKVADNYYKLPNIEDFDSRSKRHGITCYSRFDWSRVKTSQEKLANEDEEKNVNKTVGFLKTTIKL